MFKRICLMFLVLTVALCGIDCGPPPVMPFHYVHRVGAVYPVKTIPIYIDNTFGEQDKLMIEDAVSQWNFALNGYIKLYVKDDHFDMNVEVLNEVVNKGNGWLFLRINHDSTFVHDEKGFTTLAFVNEVGGNRCYFIRDRLNSEMMTGVALHEMGHLLGAQHDNVYLMRPHYDWAGYRCVDQEALKRVADYQNLPMDHLNYCEYGNH